LVPIVATVVWNVKFWPEKSSGSATTNQAVVPVAVKGVGLKNTVSKKIGDVDIASAPVI
jgi:hypothetical protein